MPPGTTSLPQNAPTAAPTGVNPSNAIQLSDGTQLDPSVVKVMAAIKQVETGGSANAYTQSGDNGQSLGAFQWNNMPNGVHTTLAPGQIPSNFQAAASKFGLNPNDFSVANQNKVAYAQISAYKAAGLTPNSIDALWNGASPDPSNPGQYIHNNTARATAFNTALQGALGGTTAPAAPATAPAPSAAPSVGGFLGNVVSSGANLLGNIGDAVLHPIQTIQGIGGAAVGGLQELGGQTNGNTQSFDNVVNYFKTRYGSVNDLAHTAYTDPIGLAADLATAFGVGEGTAAAVGKVGDIGAASKIGTAADLAREAGTGADFIADASGNVAPAADATNPVTAAARKAGNFFSTASTVVNPLTPIVSGVGALLGDSGKIASEVGSQLTGLEPKTIDQIIANPESFTPEQIANTSRAAIADQVASALNDKIDALDETGSSYAKIRADGTQVKVAKNFLEDQLRKQAGVEIKDGDIVAKGSSEVRAPKDVAALQNLLDTWKPEFQKGYLTTNEFLNFRQDLAAAAKYDKEFTASKPVEAVAAKIRSALNTTYRGAIPTLEDTDADFSSQLTELQNLRKGFIDKDGKLTEAATNSIANAAGVGRDAKLARLEQIVPGITQKLKVLKAIEDIEKAGGTKVGTYPSAFLKAGGVIGGLATGNMPLVATALATTIIASPDVAVPLLRVFGNNKALVSQVMAHLVKYATISGVSARATGAGTPVAEPESPDTTDTPDSAGSTDTQTQE